MGVKAVVAAGPGLVEFSGKTKTAEHTDTKVDLFVKGELTHKGEVSSDTSHPCWRLLFCRRTCWSF